MLFERFQGGLLYLFKVCFILFRSESTYLPVYFGDKIRTVLFSPLPQFYFMTLLKTA